MIFLFIILLCIPHVTSMKVERSYRHRNHLQRFVVNKNTGEIFIGGQNVLIRLSQQLDLIQLVENGPRLDSILCPPPQVPCNSSKFYINSFTKGLVIDHERSTIIVCSNVFQGSCQIRKLQDISFVKQDIHKPVVGYLPEDSDVLLIGPGINGNVLYVGSKYNTAREMKVYRDMVPHLSSRNLENLEFSFRDQDAGTKISLLEKFRLDVNFLYGFTDGDYVYFIITQAKSIDDNTVHTKIIRICQKDKYFRSYVEIPLLCYKDKSKPYIIAKGANFEKSSRKVFVIFERGKDGGTKSSALCRYSMSDVVMMFDTTVEQCHDGSGVLGPPHVHITTPCLKASEDTKFCGSELYPSIEGRNPITEVVLTEFTDTSLSSVLASVKNLNEIVFLGTSFGQLIKLIVSPGNQVSVVKEIDVDIGQQITKLEYSSDKSKVYAMSINKLLLVNPLHCGEKTSCEECSVGHDPVCGWCVMENRCTEAESCPRSSVLPHWLIQTSCAKMIDMQPTSLSYETIEVDDDQKQIKFKLETIMLAPHSDNLNLQCSFVSMTTKSKTAARMIDRDVIKCPLPPELPVVRKGKDYHDVEVEFHVEGRPIVKRSVPLFDCRVHESCTDCASSNFSCMWQYQDNTCITTTTNTASRQTSGITNVNECPQIESPSVVSEIMVHSGESKQIAVRVKNLKTEQRDNIHCSFEYLSAKKIVPGSISSSSLTCDLVKFEYSTPDLTPSVTAKFQITWGPNNYVLDNPTGISVRIFKCPLMVTNCGQCLSLQSEYDCGWCGSYCSLKEHCNSTFQERSAICQNPQILRFSPSIGPIGGITNVSISGINLGKTATDIESGVTVAGVRCTVLTKHYQPSFMFKCKTEPAGKVSSGPVKVTVGNIYTAESQNNFSFVEPEVLFLKPRKGPRSGGTELTIGGNYLNAGTSVTVDVGGSPCHVTHVEEKTLTCIGSAQTGSDAADVEVSFGGYKRILSPKFTYVDDPEIGSVNPRTSILSGGINIVVVGQRLEIIQRPEFFVEVGDKQITSPCKLKDINGYTFWLTCQTPKLSFPGENITVNNPKDIHYGFNLDGVTAYRNISRTFGAMAYYPDPTVFMFDGENHKVSYKKDQPLVIKGNFQSVHHISDKKVYVGRTECTNVFTSDTTLNCTVPASPQDIDRDGNAEVFIQIGKFTKDVGYVSYYEPEVEDKPIALGIILGVVIPITAIILLLAFCIIKRQRKDGPTKIKNAIPDMLKDYDTVKEEEDIGLVSVKADLNGQIPNNDSGPYISELLSRITDDDMKQKISSLLIARSQLDIGDVLGKGCYGNTYKANYKAAEDKKSEEVAIKVLQGFPKDTESVDNFVRQMVTYRDIQHDNVIPYQGVCLGAVDDPILVSPCKHCADLKTYVKDVTKNLTVTVADLLEMSQQIADGMVYLQSLNIVHGNLAARNCLITHENQVKITDYGYASLFSPEFYWAEGDKRKQILRWIAPECLEKFQLTTQSDVWSYGIVLWELLTRGVTPYPDVEPKNISQYLKGGKRLKKPRQCPEALYLLMLQCWTDVPNDRPTFQEVYSQIIKFVTKDETDNVTEPLTVNIEPGGSSEYLEVVS